MGGKNGEKSGQSRMEFPNGKQSMNNAKVYKNYFTRVKILL